MQIINDLKQKCKVCGTEYPYRKSKSYCSEPCKQKAYRFKDVKMQEPQNPQPSKDTLRLDLYERYVKKYEERFGASREAVLQGDFRAFSMAQFLYITRNHSVNEMTDEYFNYLLAMKGQCESEEYKFMDDYKYKEFFKKFLSGEFDVFFNQS